MAKINLTESQKLAVAARGDAVLVSAAAGSGKTRVLVERLVSYIISPENPKNVDDFLIITYTRAAGSELRSRIRDALDSAFAEDPHNRHLRRQIGKLSGAKIGTIHSYCSSLLREHGHLVGVTPDFTIPDEDTLLELKNFALTKLLERRYETIGDSEDFRSLVDTVGAGRDDSRLFELILSLHTRLNSQPYPEAWIKERENDFLISAEADLSETIWGKSQIDRAREYLSYWLAETEKLISRLSKNPIGNYLDSLSVTADSIREALRSLDRGWDFFRRCLPITYPTIRAGREDSGSDEAVYIKTRREACKKALQKLEGIFTAPSKELICDIALCAGAMRELLRLTADFEREFSAEKRRLSYLDFSDLEHLSLKLLLDQKTGAQTWLAVEICQRFTEIMIDEYQDISPVQELICGALSRRGKNLFMVGDVKQAIYRFRLADPSIFIEKLRRFKNLSPDEDYFQLTEPRSILLSENFRSAPGILSAVNHFFETLMSEKLGGVDYSNGHRLIPGADFPGINQEAGLVEAGEKRCVLYAIKIPEGDDYDESPGRLKTEAEFTAKKITELLSGGVSITDNGISRAVTPGDIVILLRSPGSAAAEFAAALKRAGIAAESPKAGGFFAAPEIRAMLALLSIIDNSRQDTDLIAVLLSSLFRFSADTLADIRAASRNCASPEINPLTCDRDFYDALQIHAETNPASADFLRTLSEFRELSLDLGVYELISHICKILNVYAIFAAAGGASALGALSALLTLASDYERDVRHGLFRFIEQLRRMEERGQEPELIVSPENCVRIMSIHKSKGLEFPVVFLCDTARRINRADLTEPVLIHNKLGLGPRVTDTRRGIEYPTLAFKAVASELWSETLSEELRIQYVALTRAKERLYITCALKNPEAERDKLVGAMPEPLSPVTLETVSSPCQWLLRAAAMPEIPLTLEICGGGEAEIAEPIAPDAAAKAAAVPKKAIFEINPDYIYPFLSDCNMPSKLTVTELKRRFAAAAGALCVSDDMESGEALIPKRAPIFRRPDFIKKLRPPTGAERGIATHLLMQCIDYGKTDSLEDIRAELERLHTAGFLDEREKSLAEPEKILRFFSSDTGKSLKTADRVYREFRFSLLYPASDFFGAANEFTGENAVGGAAPHNEKIIFQSESEILLQGVVDCCYERDGCLTVLDFKTDNVTADSIDSIAKSYFPQIRAYARAMREIMDKPVIDASLYFFSTGELVKVSCP